MDRHHRKLARRPVLDVRILYLSNGIDPSATYARSRYGSDRHQAHRYTTVLSATFVARPPCKQLFSGEAARYKHSSALRNAAKTSHTVCTLRGISTRKHATPLTRYLRVCVVFVLQGHTHTRARTELTTSR